MLPRKENKMYKYSEAFFNKVGGKTEQELTKILGGIESSSVNIFLNLTKIENIYSIF